MELESARTLQVADPETSIAGEIAVNVYAYWKPTLLLLACAAAGALPLTVGVPANTETIAKTIKADVAQLVAGLNAHDVAKTTAFDAPDIVSIECGSPSTIGIEADKEGFKTGFDRDPLWRVNLIDETVDVSRSGDLAVYRGTYNEDNSRAGVVMTHKTNFLAEFKRQNDGSWKIVWYSVSHMEPSHPKQS